MNSTCTNFHAFITILINCAVSRHVPTVLTWVNNNIEIWWDKHITTVPKTKNNKPDIVVWDKNEKTCFVIDVCVPLDENVHVQEKRKIDIYTPLVVNLSRLYPDYSYNIIPIVLGATGLITDSLTTYLTTLLVNEKRVRHVVMKLQRKALIGSMKILKSALKKK